MAFSDQITLKRLSLQGAGYLTVQMVGEMATDCKLFANSPVELSNLGKLAAKINRWYEKEGVRGSVAEPIAVHKQGVIVINVSEPSAIVSKYASWTHEDDRQLHQRPLRWYNSTSKAIEAPLSIKQLTDAASAALPIFRELVHQTAAIAGYSDPDRIVKAEGESIIIGAADADAPILATRISVNLKDMAKIEEKAMHRYHGDFGRVLDCCRCSIVADDEGGLDRLIQAFLRSDPTTAGFEIVRVKNRFAQPAFNGYMDVILNLKVPIQSDGVIVDHICEVQLHTASLLTRSQISYPNYVYNRRLVVAECGSAAANVAMLRNLTEQLIPLYDQSNTSPLSRHLRNWDANRLSAYSWVLSRNYLDLGSLKQGVDQCRLTLCQQKHRFKPFSKDAKCLLAKNTIELSKAAALLDCGQTREARKLLLSIQNFCEKARPGEGVSELHVMIGNSYQEDGDNEWARRHYETAFAGRKAATNAANRHYSEEVDRIKAAIDRGDIIGLRIKELRDEWRSRSAEVAKSYDEAAVCALAKSESASALLWYEKSLAVRTSMFGDNNAHVRDTREAVGKIKLMNGQYKEAKDILTALAESNDSNRAIYFESLAAQALIDGDKNEAADALEKSMAANSTSTFAMHNYSALTRKQLEAGSWGNASRMLRVLVNRGIFEAQEADGMLCDAMTVRALIDGDMLEVATVLQKVLTTNPSSRAVIRNYRVLTHKVLEVDRWTDARRMLGILVSRGVYNVIDAETAYVHAALQANELRGADASFRLVLEQLKIREPSMRLVQVIMMV